LGRVDRVAGSWQGCAAAEAGDGGYRLRAHPVEECLVVYARYVREVGSDVTGKPATPVSRALPEVPSQVVGRARHVIRKHMDACMIDGRGCSQGFAERCHRGGRICLEPNLMAPKRLVSSIPRVCKRLSRGLEVNKAVFRFGHLVPERAGKVHHIRH
jgi:hypothetical protein